MTALTDSLAEGAIQAILEARELLTDPAAVQSIRSKGETDYVTNVDVAVQAFLRERLVALAPDVQFMGEEQDNTGLDWSRPCWILDPVDGTTNLIHSFRHSCRRGFRRRSCCEPCKGRGAGIDGPDQCGRRLFDGADWRHDERPVYAGCGR